MTRFTALTGTDMTAWDLSDIAGGSVAKSTQNTWNVNGSAGTDVYSFAGAHLTYGTDGSPWPTGGMIHQFSVLENGVPIFAVGGTIAAADLVHFIASNNWAGLQREWFAGDDRLTGSNSNDHLCGYAGDDTFDLTKGGSDIAEGGRGSDTFRMDDTLDTTDRIDGGTGVDTLILNANYYLTFTAEMMTNVEIVHLAPSRDYVLHFVAGNVGRGGLTVDGSSLVSASSMTVTMEGVRGFTALGGAGKDDLSGADGRDTLTGNGGNDVIAGGHGGDLLTGGLGNDVFVYGDAHDSTTTHYDTITDFNSLDDRISLPNAIHGVDAWLLAGALSSETFESDLSLAIHGKALHKNHAVLFTPDSGDLAGHTFLVIDQNGRMGYQGGTDLVIALGDGSDLTHLGKGDFVVHS